MLTAIGDVMREAYKRGWVTTRDGNISLRRGNKFYITPSGVRKTIIHPEHIMRGKLTHDGIFAEVDFGDNNVKPSGEFEMHLMLQAAATTCQAVVHLHPTYTIAAMLKGIELKKLASMFPELSRYTRVGDNVNVHPVCSPGLAEETYKKMTNETGKIMFDVVGQAQHGVTAVAKNPWDAFEHIERLEHICQIALASGVNFND